MCQHLVNSPVKMQEFASGPSLNPSNALLNYPVFNNIRHTLPGTRLASFQYVRKPGTGFCGQWMVVLAVCVPACLASVNSPRPSLARQWDTERTVWPASFHHTAQRAITRCESARPAEALATPDPLLDGIDVRSKVAVSFIIGTDGRVHSPVVIESGGSDEDSSVLEAVRGWRYRPATCNRVPAETESKVEFSSRSR
jgi:TonB family protein